MKKSLVCLLVIELAIVGAGQTTLAKAEPQHERDLAVDQALGGLEEGSRMLAPEGQGASESHSGAIKPGGTLSPRDAGAVTSGSPGSGAAKPGGGQRSTGGFSSQGGTGFNTSAGGGTQTSGAQQGGGITGGGTSTGTGTGSGPLGGGDTGPGSVQEPGGGTGGETGGGTETGSTGTGTSGSLIDLNLDANTSTGEVNTDLSVGGEPLIEADLSTGADLSGTTDTVTADTGTTLDAGVVTDTTTLDASTETTEDNLTVDVSAGSDTLGDALLGTGSEIDPDATTSEETTDILDDCSVLDPLSLPDHCL